MTGLPHSQLPKRVQAGHMVGICAPASPVRLEFLERGEAALHGLGYRTRRSPNILARGRYTAGTVAERLSDLTGLLSDAEVQAIFFARGGYGVMELLDQLDPALIRHNRKVLLGSSDLTALLNYATVSSGVPSFHGPMVAGEIAKGLADLSNLSRLLGEPVAFGPIAAPELRALHEGKASGRLVGGCLTLLTAVLGTPFDVDYRGCVVFIEDQDTKPYQVDRMLTQLRLAGKFDKIAGIVFGEMLGCHQHPMQGYELDEVLSDLTRGFGVPVLTGVPSGHTSGEAQTLALGVQTTLQTDPPQIATMEPAVREDTN